MSELDDSLEGPALPERYAYLDLLGIGGMGEVIRVHDRVLQRSVAMKIIRSELSDYSKIAARFEAEAIATAQLEHPGIVPIHDYGQLPDRRPYFTMQQIRGDTLTAVAYPVHMKSRRAHRWSRSKSGWTLTRLLDAFRQACQAVAHAHSRGVLHRDLKPDNLMIGQLGEVLVVDWGLAKVHARASPEEPSSAHPSPRDPLQSRAGSIAGTPAFMPPEQAHGRNRALGPTADVYALGSILYFLLSGRFPYNGDAQDVLAQVRAGPPQLLQPLAAVPEPLLDICSRAMEREAADRYPDASALADALLAYEDGNARRQKALELVRSAQDVLPEVWSLQERARVEHLRARTLSSTLKPWDSAQAKQALWDAEDRADTLRAQAELAEHRTTQLLRGALTHAPELAEAHAVLADLYRQRHEEAEHNRDAPAERRYALLLADHDVGGAHAAYLRGDGAVSLHTEIPVQVECLRYMERGRRLVLELHSHLGSTPLDEVPLPQGSYLLRLTAPGRDPVDYPVYIERLGHWDGVAPGATEPTPIRIPGPDELDESEVYVPAGWFWYGGRDTLGGGAEADLERRWVQGFAIHRHPVTNAQYLEYLNALVADGRAREAKRHVPRHRGEAGAPIYGRLSDGRFALVPDSDGDTWEPDWPVLLVSWESATAYARWVSQRSGRPCRLPWEVEWEKAARGVDRRRAPWGGHLEPTWACVRGGRAGRALPAAVGAHPLDRSPYGMMGAAGNCGDWCEDEVTPGQRAYRGGAWSYPVSFCELTARRSAASTGRGETIGVRIARTLPDPTR